MAQENIDVTVRLRDQLSAQAQRTRNALEDVGNAAGKADREMKALQRRIIEERLALNALDRALGKTERKYDALGNEIKKTTASAALAKAMFTGLGGSLDRASKKSKGLGDAMKALKLPAIATAATLVAGAIAAIGAAAVAAVAGLAPLVGVLGAIPALGAALGQTAATMKLGFSGIGEALKVLNDPAATAEELNAALGKLGPEARDLAVQLAELKEQTNGWKDSVQAAMLPGFSRGLKNIGGLLPVIERGLVGSGRELGVVGEKMGALVGTFGPDLGTIMDRNNRMIRNGLGPAILAVTNILRNLMVAGGPLAERFANFVGRAATNLDRMVTAGRQSGKLEAFFNRAGDLAAAVGRVIGDIAVGLFNIGRESSDLGNMMGRGIGDVARQFREFTESVEGKASIRKFFQDAMPVVRELARLVRDVVFAFGGLAATEELAPLIAQIRTEMLPAAVALTGFATSKLGPAFVDLATAWLTFSNTLSFDPLVTAVAIFADVMKQITSMISLTPGASTFFATILTGLLAWKLFAFALKATGIMAFAGKVKTATGFLRGFTLVLRGNTAAIALNNAAQGRGAVAAVKWQNGMKAVTRNARIMGAAIKAGMIGTSVAQMTQGLGRLSKAQRIAAGAARMLGVAMRFMMGPWGIAIAIIIALGVVLWQLYKRNERFRELVNRVAAAVVSFAKTAWAWIKRVGIAVGMWLVGAWQKVWPVIKQVGVIIWDVMQAAWGVIKSVATRVWSIMKTVGSVVKDVFMAIWGVVKTVFGVVFSIVRFFYLFWLRTWQIIISVFIIIFMVVWKIIKFVFGLVMAYLRNYFFPFWKLMWNIIKTVAGAVWDAISTAFGWVMEKIKIGLAILQAVWGIVWGVIKRVALAIWEPIAAAAKWVWEKISAGVGWLKDEVSRRFDILKERIQKVWDFVSGGASTAFGGIMKVVQPVIDAVKRVFQGLGDTIGGIWGGIKSGLSSALDGVVGIINGLIGHVNTLIDGLNKVNVIGDDIPHIPTIGGTRSSSSRTSGRNGATSSGGGLFTGGATVPGVAYTVAELGPELFVPRTGPLSVLGGDGGAMPWVAPRSGYVVPNPGTPDSLTNPIPSWVHDRLDTMPYAGPGAGRPAAGGTAVVEAVPDMHLHFHGDGSQLTEADVERAALNAWRKFDRERKERR